MLKMNRQRRYRGEKGNLLAPDLIDSRGFEDMILLAVGHARIAGKLFEEVPISSQGLDFYPTRIRGVCIRPPVSLGAVYDAAVLPAEYRTPIILRIVVRMQSDFPAAKPLFEHHMYFQHLLYRRRSVQVVVFDQIDELATIVARLGKRRETRCVVTPVVERDEFDRVFAISEYPSQRRHSFGRRVIIKDAQDDVVVGTIDRSDEGLRTAKHDLTFGSADVSVCAVHAYIRMRLKVNVEFHINAAKSAGSAAT
jgi:hypothetical protein